MSERVEEMITDKITYFDIVITMFDDGYYCCFIIRPFRNSEYFNYQAMTFEGSTIGQRALRIFWFSCQYSSMNFKITSGKTANTVKRQRAILGAYHIVFFWYSAFCGVGHRFHIISKWIITIGLIAYNGCIAISRHVCVTGRHWNLKYWVEKLYKCVVTDIKRCRKERRYVAISPCTVLYNPLKSLMYGQNSSIGLTLQWNLGKKIQRCPASSIIICTRGWDMILTNRQGFMHTWVVYTGLEGKREVQTTCRNMQFTGSQSFHLSHFL